MTTINSENSRTSINGIYPNTETFSTHYLRFPLKDQMPIVKGLATMHSTTQKSYLTEHGLSPWTLEQFHDKLISYGNAVALTYPDTPSSYDFFQMHTDPVVVFDQSHIRLGTFGFSEDAMQRGRKAASIELAGKELGTTHPETTLWIEVCGEPTKFEKVLTQSGFSPSPNPEFVENLLDASGIATIDVWQEKGITYHATPTKEYPQKILVFER